MNGKPIRFYKDDNDIIVPEDTGAVIFANCTNVMIDQMNLSDTAVAITISYSSNITITNNSINSNNHAGIKARASSDMLISENTFYPIEMEYWVMLK